MPIYVYKCNICGKEKEVLTSVKNKAAMDSDEFGVMLCMKSDNQDGPAPGNICVGTMHSVIKPTYFKVK